MEYRAYKTPKEYVVTLSVETPRGERTSTVVKRCRTMKEARMAADMFNRETGVTA